MIGAPWHVRAIGCGGTEHLYEARLALTAAGSSEGSMATREPAMTQMAQTHVQRYAAIPKDSRMLSCEREFKAGQSCSSCDALILSMSMDSSRKSISTGLSSRHRPGLGMSTAGLSSRHKPGAGVDCIDDLSKGDDPARTRLVPDGTDVALVSSRALVDDTCCSSRIPGAMSTITLSRT